MGSGAGKYTEIGSNNTNINTHINANPNLYCNNASRGISITSEEYESCGNRVSSLRSEKRRDTPERRVTFCFSDMEDSPTEGTTAGQLTSENSVSSGSSGRLEELEMVQPHQARSVSLQSSGSGMRDMRPWRSESDASTSTLLVGRSAMMPGDVSPSRCMANRRRTHFHHHGNVVASPPPLTPPKLRVEGDESPLGGDLPKLHHVHEKLPLLDTKPSVVDRPRHSSKSRVQQHEILPAENSRTKNEPILAFLPERKLPRKLKSSKAESMTDLRKSVTPPEVKVPPALAMLASQKQHSALDQQDQLAAELARKLGRPSSTGRLQRSAKTSSSPSFGLLGPLRN